MKSLSVKKGKIAENMAAWFLRSKGFTIVKKNFKPKQGTGAGEVDIIAKKKNLIVFVEVKARNNETTAIESILPKQIERIIKSAELFLAENPEFNNFDVRFDVILICNKVFPTHIPDAFRA